MTRCRSYQVMYRHHSPPFRPSRYSMASETAFRAHLAWAPNAEHPTLAYLDETKVSQFVFVKVDEWDARIPISFQVL